jgi:hypothetical protein
MGALKSGALFAGVVTAAILTLVGIVSYLWGVDDGRKRECERLHPEAHSCTYVDREYEPLYRDETED